MYPTRLNTSWPDKQLLLCVTATTGELRLRDGLGGAEPGTGRLQGMKIYIPFYGNVALVLV